MAIASTGEGAVSANRWLPPEATHEPRVAVTHHSNKESCRYGQVTVGHEGQNTCLWLEPCATVPRPAVRSSGRRDHGYGYLNQQGAIFSSMVLASACVVVPDANANAVTDALRSVARTAKKTTALAALEKESATSVAERRALMTRQKVATVGLKTTADGAVIVSVQNAKLALQSTADSAIRANSSFLSRISAPELNRRYPGLHWATMNPSKPKYKEFVEANPTLLDDVALYLYRESPDRFLQEATRGVEVLRSEVGAVFQETINRQNGGQLQALMDKARVSLEAQGFSKVELQAMEPKLREKLIEQSVSKEVDTLLRDTTFKWSYKSGDLSVKGDVGHFAIDQLVPIGTIAKWLLGTGVAATTGVGVSVAFDKTSLTPKKSCIGGVCLSVGDEKPEPKVRYVENTDRPISVDAVK